MLAQGLKKPLTQSHTSYLRPERFSGQSVGGMAGARGMLYLLGLLFGSGFSLLCFLSALYLFSSVSLGLSYLSLGLCFCVALNGTSSRVTHTHTQAAPACGSMIRPTPAEGRSIKESATLLFFLYHFKHDEARR